MSQKEYRKKLMDAELAAILAQFEALAGKWREFPIGGDDFKCGKEHAFGDAADELSTLVQSVKKERGLL